MVNPPQLQFHLTLRCARWTPSRTPRLVSRPSHFSPTIECQPHPLCCDSCDQSGPSSGQSWCSDHYTCHFQRLVFPGTLAGTLTTAGAYWSRGGVEVHVTDAAAGLRSSSCRWWTSRRSSSFDHRWPCDWCRAAPMTDSLWICTCRLIQRVAT